jgi:ABC-type nickel/cobalt efflux system permease component RcnA
MPKALCLISLVASILVAVLFLADAAMGMLGMQDVAPLRSANLTMDIAFVLLAATMIYLSWSTYREQR